MIKGSIQEEDITLINIYACSVGAPKYIKQLLTGHKGRTYCNKEQCKRIQATPNTSMDRSSRQENQQGNRDPN